jgi:hypothetical protein
MLCAALRWFAALCPAVEFGALSASGRFLAFGRCFSPLLLFSLLVRVQAANYMDVKVRPEAAHAGA